MAKPNPTTKKSETQPEIGDTAVAAEAPTAGTGLALHTSDELAGIVDVGEFDTDGLEEVDSTDLKIALKLNNMKGKGPDGRAIPPDVFFDTVSETTKTHLRVVPLLLHKTNEWKEFNNATNESEMFCSSRDRVTGTMRKTLGTLTEGTVRPCKECPDHQWRTDPATNKRSRRCGPVHNVVVIDRDDGQPAIVRFKRTGLPAWQTYLSKHFLGRRVVKGERTNYPLFAFETTIGLEMDDGGKYSMPTFKRGPVLSAEEIRVHARNAAEFRETIVPDLEKIMDKDKGADSSGGEGGSNLNPADFQDGPAGGAPPPPPPPAASAPNRF